MASGAWKGILDDHAHAAAEVWILDPDRGHRPAFTRQMARYGFELVEQERVEGDEWNDGERPYKGRFLRYLR